jgi:hypothetical protein
MKMLIRKKLAENAAAEKRKAAARRGAVGIASTPSLGVLLPPATATITLVFHIIQDVTNYATGQPAPVDVTAGHRDPDNYAPGDPRAGVPTCSHLTGELQR